ncbi:hypothetical protein OKW41_006302 [Paraburkholderia sp. UCT70]|uniref:hypothetical protein n=1 Tax=Paraburkholderia sp. UCT70 TaxID=2991068 RepID=UPI003D214C27
MLVTYVLGDCPGCKQQNSFGNVNVCGDHVLRGCMRCRYSQSILLPAVRKKVIYLDQFFFSGAFRGGDDRFVRAAERIQKLAADQLLVAPFSSIHEDETHLWPRFGELYPFIKSASRGAEFKQSSEVDRFQLHRAFMRWQQNGPADQQPELSDALKPGHVSNWDSYFRIEVGGYHGDAELLARLKLESVEGLVDLFPGWRESQNTFDQDVDAEYNAAAKGYMDAYLEFMVGVGGGDYMALFDSPVMSMVVQGLLAQLPEETPPDERLRQCARFLDSQHFKSCAHQWLRAHMYATLKAQVKAGSYANRERALGRLSGVFFDVSHISTYAPYVDAFIMDQPMAELVSHRGVRLSERYGTRVFSLNNWPELFAWFDELENSMTDEHRQGLRDAYPRRVEMSLPLVKSMSEQSTRPDPLRVRYRAHLGDAMRQIVLFGSTLDQAIKAVKVPEVDIAAFNNLLNSELEHLEAYNCARHCLPMGKTQDWIDKGRPH